MGCQKVSPGCDHCYAETLMDHRCQKIQWGPHGERKRTSEGYWKLPLHWARQARQTAGRPRVFCASLADWLDNRVAEQWRTDLAVLIDGTPELDWLLLTKRIENYGRLSPWSNRTVPSNVWLGATCEDQHYYDRRWRLLSAIPAAARFISYEPALGPLTFASNGPHPDWLICGGESSAGWRQMDLDWARSIQADCKRTRTAFFMKQVSASNPKDPTIPAELSVREFPSPRIRGIMAEAA